MWVLSICWAVTWYLGKFLFTPFRYSLQNLVRFYLKIRKILITYKSLVYHYEFSVDGLWTHRVVSAFGGWGGLNKSHPLLESICMCVTSSTDSQLKLWRLNAKPSCVRTFRGHVNDKNFVGLATDGDYLACGRWCRVFSFKTSVYLVHVAKASDVLWTLVVIKPSNE